MMLSHSDIMVMDVASPCPTAERKEGLQGEGDTFPHKSVFVVARLLYLPLDFNQCNQQHPHKLFIALCAEVIKKKRGLLLTIPTDKAE